MNDTKEKPATFTPGPWHVRLGEDYYHVHGEVQVALVENWTVEDPRGNARLIASAPEMLDALKNVKRALGMPVSLEAIRLLVDEAIHKAEAKVEGGEG